MSYVKLFAEILDSTIWQESKETKLVWITILAKKDRHGVVLSSVPGLAKTAGVTIKEAEAALVVLMSPDPYSRTKTHEGRRVEEVDGGWYVINHGKYREKESAEDRKEQAKIRQQRFRDKKKTVRANGTKPKRQPGEDQEQWEIRLRHAEENGQ